MVSAVALFADRDAARNCVSALETDCLCLGTDGERLAGQQQVDKRQLRPRSLHHSDRLWHVMSWHIISHHTSHSAVSHITCSHCTSCVPCHTVRDEGTIITGLLFCCCCFVVVLLLFTDYFTACYCRRLHWSTKFNFFFFGTRGKISNPNRTFKAEFKCVSSFSPSPTVCLWEPS